MPKYIRKSSKRVLKSTENQDLNPKKKIDITEQEKYDHGNIVKDNNDEHEEKCEMDLYKPGPSSMNPKKKEITQWIVKDPQPSTKNKESNVPSQSLDPEVEKSNSINCNLSKSTSKEIEMNDVTKLQEELAASREENKMIENKYSQLENKYNQLVSILSSKVECPVCFEVPEKAPIPTCPNGHVICTACVKRTSICPTCRVKMKEDTSPIAVAIIDNIPHACRFQSNGCDVTCMLPELESHLKMCPFRTAEKSTSECSGCGKEFKGARGLRSHLNKSKCGKRAAAARANIDGAAEARADLDGTVYMISDDEDEDSIPDEDIFMHFDRTNGARADLNGTVYLISDDEEI